MTEAQISMLETLQNSEHYISHRVEGVVVEVRMTRHAPYLHNPYGLDGWCNNEKGVGGYLIPPSAGSMTKDGL
ncbi:TPA: hypothetical protein ACOLX2_003260 [Vibrio parahaemolyticus]